MKRLMMLFVAGILLVPAVGWSFDGADFPVGYPNGDGWNRGHNCFASSCSDFSCSDGLGFLEPHNYGGSIGCVLHPGEDWNKNTGGNTDCGETVRAMADGVVTAVPSSCSWGTLVIRHDNVPGYGTLYSVYGHMDNAWPGIVVRSVVQRGDPIGSVSDKGLNGAPCHLHFEIRKTNLAACFFPTNVGGGNDEDWVRARYLEPSVFIDANRPGSVTPAYHCTKVDNSPPQTAVAGQVLNLFVSYQNTGTEYWTNNQNVSDPHSVELWSCDGSGTIVNSWFDPVGWVGCPSACSDQRITGATDAQVDPQGIATFSFQAKVPDSATPGSYQVWFRPTHGGQLMDDWGGVNITVNVQSPPTDPCAGGPCPGRYIPNSCLPEPGMCCPNTFVSLQPLLDMSSRQWSAPGMPVQKMLEPDKEYSLNFEYRSASEQQFQLGLGGFNSLAKQLGSEVGSTTLPASSDWKTFWSAPFTLTAEQLREHPNLRLLAGKPDGIEIRNVRILQTSQ